MMRKHIYVFLGVCIALTACDKEEEKTIKVANFQGLPFGTGEYWNGADETGGFVSGDIFFPNSYTDYGGGFIYWSGFAYSKMYDDSTPGMGNQFSSFSGSLEGSKNSFGVYSYDFYALHNNTFFFLDSLVGVVPVSIDITNTTWAALSMRYGDEFAKKFGGEDGNDPDWFKLTFQGIGIDNLPTDTVEVYLADYRNADNTKDYIQKGWRKINLLPLRTVKAIGFSLSSSDVGDYGMNTPAYFCLDNLIYEVDN